MVSQTSLTPKYPIAQENEKQKVVQLSIAKEECNCWYGAYIWMVLLANLLGKRADVCTRQQVLWPARWLFMTCTLSTYLGGSMKTASLCLMPPCPLFLLWRLLFAWEGTMQLQTDLPFIQVATHLDTNNLLCVPGWMCALKIDVIRNKYISAKPKLFFLGWGISVISFSQGMTWRQGLIWGCYSEILHFQTRGSASEKVRI